MKDWKSYERKIAKDLGAWWGCTFRRTPCSGAWGKQGQSRYSTNSDAAGSHHGDIVAPAEANFPFSVECKCYKEVEIYKAMYGKSNVYDWWKQCKGDTPEGMWPMLVMKENNKKPLVAVSLAVFYALRIRIKRKRVPYIILKGQGQILVIMDLVAFTSGVSAAFVKKTLGQENS